MKNTRKRKQENKSKDEKEKSELFSKILEVLKILLPQSWTLISGHMRNVAEKFFSANVQKVFIFGLLFRTWTINDFSY